jgi:hypothetical protein
VRLFVSSSSRHLCSLTAQQVMEAQARGVRVDTASIPFSYLKAWLASSTVLTPRLLLCLLDWSVVLAGEAVPPGSCPSGGYCGHFVVVVGCTDDGRVALLNPDEVSAQKRGFPLPSTNHATFIRLETFEAARKSAGTDEDLIFFSAREGSARGDACSKEGVNCAAVDTAAEAGLEMFPPFRVKWNHALLVAVLVVALYSHPTMLDGDFVYDDGGTITGNPVTQAQVTTPSIISLHSESDL